ncbi:MAG: DUF58 domain-containing protein [Pirellulales bacterium]
MKWFFGILLLLLAALAFRLGLLAYAMYVLLGLLVVSRFLAREWIGGLSATRTSSQLTAQVNEAVAVGVTVHNRGRLPVPWVLMEDVVHWPPCINGPPPVKLRGKRLKISLLSRGGSTTLFYQVEFKQRGYYQIGPTVLESGDLFGLHRRFESVTEPQFVLVFPRVVPLNGYDIASRRPIGEIRLTHRLYEDPTRISGVRLYELGDPLNRVHWRATARTGQLHCKVYESTAIAGATILLDFHTADFDRRHEPYRSELAVSAAASVANALYQMGQQLGLVTNGRDAAERIRTEGWRHDYRTRQAALAAGELSQRNDRLAPLVVDTRRGPEQLGRILELLARVELTDGLTFSQMVLETASRLPRDATLVVVISDVTLETAVALGNLRRRGFAIAAIVNLYEDSDYSRCAGLLLGEGIESRHLKDEQALSGICSRLVMR